MLDDICLQMCLKTDIRIRLYLATNSLYLHVDSAICFITKVALPMSPVICWTSFCSIFSLPAWFAAMYVLLGTAFLVNGQPYDGRTLLFVGQTYTAMFEFEAYTPRNYVVSFSGILNHFVSPSIGSWKVTTKYHLPIIKSKLKYSIEKIANLTPGYNPR